MRVLYICPSIPVEPFNGYEAILHHRLKYLKGMVQAAGVFCTPNAVLSAAQHKALEYFERHTIIRRHRAQIPLGLAAAGLRGLPFQTGLFPQGKVAAAVSDLVEKWKPDLIDVFMMRMAPSVSHIRTVPVVYSLIDSMHSNLIGRSERSRGIESGLARVEAGRSQQYERRLARSGRPIVLVSTHDAGLLRSEGATVELIPIGVDTDEFSPDASDVTTAPRYDVVFSGNMYYDPNGRAVDWFVRRCWPQIRKTYPNASFAVVGNRPPPDIVQLDGLDGIRVLGRVPSIASVLRETKVAVAPMQSGSGLQFKVLEALACARPVVATPRALAGFGSSCPRGAIVAEHEADFSREVCSLLADSDLRARLGAEGREDVRTHFGWQRQAERAFALYQKTVGSSAMHDGGVSND